MIRHLIFALFVLAFSGCSDDEGDNNPSPNENPPEFELLARVNGIVQNSGGDPVANAAIHVVYEPEPVALSRNNSSPDDPQLPSQTTLYTTTPMLTECDGDDALAFGVTVKIFWDSDSDGADADDPQPPVCNHPPNCDDGPFRSVNYNQFTTNNELGEGTFVTERDFTTVGDMLDPNRFYLRIYCADGNPLYTSDVIELPSGFSSQDFPMHCTTCEGAPPTLEWRLDPVYPNPVLTTTTVHFGLAEASDVVLGIRHVGTNNLDVPYEESLPAGFYDRVFDLTDKPNGAYIYAIAAGAFLASDTLIKNVADSETLRGEPAGSITDTDGSFSINVPCTITTDLRGSQNENLGEAVLNRARITALAPGFQPADTVLDLIPQTDFNVQLTLFPQ